jgi:two-component system response regulator HydG
MATVLIIDDEHAVTAGLAGFFEREHVGAVEGGSRLDVIVAHNAAEGVAAIRRAHPDVVLLDARLPDNSGVEVLEQVRDLRPIVIMLTEIAEIPEAVRAMQAGAESFLTKPVEFAHLVAAVERALEKSRLRQINRYLSERQGRLPATSLLGSSPAMRDVAQQVALLAESDRTTVLITGESGTGKGYVAETIHRASRRADRPMVEVNCAALAGDALDSELFGQETSTPGGGSESVKSGLFEMAEGGGVFLDEIGDLDSHLQPKLLRVLESRSFRRFGGAREIPTNTRLIAATAKDLVAEVTAGRYREDLYYRLSVMPIILPPLRARSREDLMELIAHLLQELRPHLLDAPLALDDEAIERLLRYSWPGNVRELRNVLERAMIVARGLERVGADHLPTEVREAAGAGGEHHVPRTLSEVERIHIDRTLRAHNANRTRAARELGISRATLIKKIKEYGLESNGVRPLRQRIAS